MVSHDSHQLHTWIPFLLVNCFAFDILQLPVVGFCADHLEGTSVKSLFLSFTDNIGIGYWQPPSDGKLST